MSENEGHCVKECAICHRGMLRNQERIRVLGAALAEEKKRLAEAQEKIAAWHIYIGELEMKLKAGGSESGGAAPQRSEGPTEAESAEVGSAAANPPAPAPRLEEGE